MQDDRQRLREEARVCRGDLGAAGELGEPEAIDLADREGLAALTMQAVAQPVLARDSPDRASVYQEDRDSSSVPAPATSWAPARALRARSTRNDGGSQGCFVASAAGWMVKITRR